MIYTRKKAQWNESKRKHSPSGKSIIQLSFQELLEIKRKTFPRNRVSVWFEALLKSPKKSLWNFNKVPQNWNDRINLPMTTQDSNQTTHIYIFIYLYTLIQSHLFYGILTGRIVLFTLHNKTVTCVCFTVYFCLFSFEGIRNRQKRGKLKEFPSFCHFRNTKQYYFQFILASNCSDFM